jgi:uncharacterized protein YndB with AHSA1/START domain
VPRNESQVEIARPAADVFPYLVEAERRREWVHGLVESTPLDDGGPRVGSRFRDVVVDHGQRMTVDAEVEHYEPNTALTARLRARGFVSRLSYRLQELDGRTRVACTLETEFTMRVARLAGPLVTRQAQKALDASFRNLKRVLEE